MEQNLQGNPIIYSLRPHLLKGMCLNTQERSSLFSHKGLTGLQLEYLSKNKYLFFFNDFT